MAAKYVVGRLPAAQIAEDCITNQARAWIEECLTNHKACPSSKKAFLPTRVIDLEAISVQGASCLHISKRNETADYAALSYCWGEAQKTMLLTTTILEAWKVRLPIEDLPRTLKDAVKVTRGLGIKYLWVDALCILQDSSTDKKVEIERMGKIYKSAKVTIAAATARGVSEGFLSTRDPPALVTVPFLCPNSMTTTISLASPIYAYHPEQPLDSRAWALQEYLLSPRLLMYGASELTWHCQTRNFQPIGKSHLFYWSVTPRLPPGLFDGGSSRLKSGSRQKYKMWTSIAADYSGRLLTYPDDKLSAIAGIANELSQTWQDSYIHGIWKSYLVYYLAWRRDVRVKSNVGRSDRAPTWSWLSMDCRVDFWPYIGRVDAEVGEYSFAHAVLPSNSSHSATTKLVLRAKILIATDLPKTLISSWLINWDLSNEHLVEGSVQFLLLGTSETKHPSCLILTSSDSGLYHRVGLATHCYTDKWLLCPPRVITIV